MYGLDQTKFGLERFGVGDVPWGVGGQSSCEGWTKATHTKFYSRELDGFMVLQTKCVWESTNTVGWTKMLRVGGVRCGVRPGLDYTGRLASLPPPLHSWIWVGGSKLGSTQ